MKKSFFIPIFLLTLLMFSFPAFSQNGKFIICLDAGHGGKDPGALGKKAKEKDICLAIALKAGGYITANIPKAEVIYTRDKDVYVELGQRPDFANAEKADLFISVHINSCNNKKVYGASTYVAGEGRKDDNLILALTLQENGGEFSKDSIPHEDWIAISKLREEHLKQSMFFAAKLQEQFKKRMGRKDLGVKKANFAVLWRAQMPAVLIECGFLSNASEETFMNSEQGQELFASAIYRTIKIYLKEYAKEYLEGSTVYVPQQTEKPVPEKSVPEKSVPEKSDVFYMVQIKSSDKKIALTDKSFKGLQNVAENFWDGKYKYTVGKSQDFKEITKLQNETRKKIPDAFVIAVQGGKKISVQEAKKILEKK